MKIKILFFLLLITSSLTLSAWENKPPRLRNGSKINVHSDGSVCAYAALENESFSPLNSSFPALIKLKFCSSEKCTFISSPFLNDDVQLVEKILEKLVAARGIPLPNQMPTVKIDAQDLEGPAAAFLGANVLQIHPKTIAICKEFGSEYKDVLAAILGHELVHFYQQHTCYFTHRSEGVDAIEFEADWQGLFNVYLAGYKIKGEGPSTLQSRLVSRIYKEFALKENLPGYPSLSARKRMVEQTEMKINELTMLFEAANYAVLRGSFEIAIESYRYLLKNLEAKELHHNLAIAYASLFKQYYRDVYSYPFELNTDFRLYTKVRGDYQMIDSIEQGAMKHYNSSTKNSHEITLFEVSLALIKNDDLEGLAFKLNNLPYEVYQEEIDELKKILVDKENGIERSLSNHKKQIQVFDNCGYFPAFLEYFHPQEELTGKLKVLFDFNLQITALLYKDSSKEGKKFVVQTYSYNCLKKSDLRANYTVKHQQGTFYIYLEESAILTTKNGTIKGAWVWPGFRH